MSPELEDLYQQVLLDHSKRPRNFGEIAEGAVKVHGDNPSCGDEIDLCVRFGPEREVAEIKFTGQGCAICMASASMMTTKLKGRSRAEATALLDSFHTLVTKGDGAPSPALGDLQLMEGVRKFPQRVKCAMLAWRAFEQALAAPGTDGAAEVSTETRD
ncbi:MAG: SUF system NifU family Fe-S cluster assembly protein [Chthoniobacteraceae bacterium]